MPTTYAHYVFGQDCLNTLDEKLKIIINNNIDIFNYAVHGPDIFFYDLLHNNVSKYGSNMHHLSGKEIFKSFKETYLNNNSDEKLLTYIIGFLTHYTLDSTCHSYVEAKRIKSNISHNLVEAQWDSHLMKENKLIVINTDRSASLKPSLEVASSIASFYPFDDKTIYRANKNQKRIIKATNYTSINRYKKLKKILISLKLNDFSDLLMSDENLKVCQDSNLRLDKLKVKALQLFPSLLNSLLEFLNEDKPLPAYFEHDLEQWPDYLDLPILSYEEELTYILN